MQWVLIHSPIRAYGMVLSIRRRNILAAPDYYYIGVCGTDPGIVEYLININYKRLSLSPKIGHATNAEAVNFVT